MLTVSRLMSDAVNKAAAKGADAYQIIDVMLQSGEAALKKTPDMLPVLKEAGVVDSGGMGLLTIYRGFKMALDGEELSENLGDLPSLEPNVEARKDAFCRVVRFDTPPTYIVLDGSTVKNSLVKKTITNFRTHSIEKLQCEEYLPRHNNDYVRAVYGDSAGSRMHGL